MFGYDFGINPTFKFPAFMGRSLITPKDCVPNDPVVSVHHHKPVHLSCKSDGANVLSGGFKAFGEDS